MNLYEKMIVSVHAMVRQVGEETVILDLVSGTYFGLDPVGARIWQLMTQGQTLAQVCETMLNEYDVTPEHINRDVLALVQELTDKQLVSVSA